MKFSTTILCSLMLAGLCAVFVPAVAQTEGDSLAPALVQDSAQTPAPAVIYPPAQDYPPPIEDPQTEIFPPETALEVKPDAGPHGGDGNDYEKGRVDGRLDAKGNALWVLAGSPGLCCSGVGVVGVALSILVPPRPPVSNLLGKSSSYIQGYTEGYKSKARWKNAGWSSLGCIAGTAVVTAIYVVSSYTLLSEIFVLWLVFD